MISTELFELLNFEDDIYGRFGSYAFFDAIVNIVFPNNVDLDDLVAMINDVLMKDVVIPRVKVKNFSFSMQASSLHYCSPRSSEGPWRTIELGALNFRPPRWILKYAENASNYANTVYGNVPIRLVARLIKKLQKA